MWRIPTRHTHQQKPDFSSALIPIAIVAVIMLLIVVVCKVYRWNSERKQQLLHLETIYETLEEINPLKSIAEEEHEFRIRLHKAVCMPCEISPFFQPRPRYHPAPYLPTLYLTTDVGAIHLPV
ncbi:hypothetical protein PFISCL1PPCAC_17263, partial [Pristionchus fissidentatus]